MIRGAEGERVVTMDDFHVGPYMTAVGDGGDADRDPDPASGRAAGSAHEKVERRAGDFAIAAVSAAVWVDGGRSPTPASRSRRRPDHDRRHPRRGAAARARRRPRSCSRRPAQIAAEDCMPMPDGRGPVDYKRHLAGVLTKRALRRATARAPCTRRPRTDASDDQRSTASTVTPRRRAAHAAGPLHPRHARA